MNSPQGDLGPCVEVGSPNFHALINGQDCVDSPLGDWGHGTWDLVWKWEGPTCTPSSTVEIAWIHLQGTGDWGLGSWGVGELGSWGVGDPVWNGKPQLLPRPHQRSRLCGFISRGLGTPCESGKPLLPCPHQRSRLRGFTSKRLGDRGLGARVEVGSPNYFHALINGRDGVDSAEGGEGVATPFKAVLKEKGELRPMRGRA